MIAPLTIINRNKEGQIVSINLLSPVIVESLPDWNERVTEMTLREIRLAKAAPQMLEALIAANNLFYHTFAQDGTVHKQIKAAIEAAGGDE